MLSRRRLVATGASVLIGITLATSGCAPKETAGARCGKTGQQVGQVIGAVGGAAAGYFLGQQVGGTTAHVVGATLGGFAGAVIGNQLGALLDECEQQQVARATHAALDSKGVGPAATQTWSSQSNPDVSGTATPVNQFVDTSGSTCRTVVNVVNVNNKDVRQQNVYCRNPQTGAWTPQEV